MANQVNLLYAGALLFTYAACIHGRYVNYLSALKQECSDWNSCLHMRPEYKTDFTQRNCECDFLCASFNDCCYDAIARRKYPYYFRNQLDTCLRYGVYDEAVYVVGSCPHDFRASGFIKSFCEGQDDFRDPFMSTPVTSVSSNSTYRNRYCALCNGERTSVLTPWETYIRFDDSYPHLTNGVIVNEIDFVFSDDFKKWGVYDDDTFRPFEIIFQKPDSVFDVRHCRSNLISSCPSSWKYENVAKNCRGYIGVVHHGHHSYRNVDCAICNGVDGSQLTCNGNIRLTRFVQFDPFVVQMNQGVYSGGQPRCSYGMTYDRFYDTCRDMSPINKEMQSSDSTSGSSGFCDQYKSICLLILIINIAFNYKK